MGYPISAAFQHGLTNNLVFTRSARMANKTDDAAAQAQLRIVESAGAMEESAEHLDDSADRRTVLAADRTILAAERTYAAWVRTGLAALASGVGARALLDKIVPAWPAGATGTMLILFSGFCFIAGVWRELRPGPPPPRPDTPRLPSALLIGLNGFLLMVSIASLIGIWLTPR